MTTTVLFCQQQTNPHVHIPFLSITPISSSCFHNLCYFLWFHLFFPLFYLCLLLNSSLHFHSFCLPPSPRSLISIFAILCLFPSSSSNISSLFLAIQSPLPPYFLLYFSASPISISIFTPSFLPLVPQSIFFLQVNFKKNPLSSLLPSFSVVTEGWMRWQLGFSPWRGKGDARPSLHTDTQSCTRTHTQTLLLNIWLRLFTV